MLRRAPGCPLFPYTTRFRSSSPVESASVLQSVLRRVTESPEFRRLASEVAEGARVVSVAGLTDRESTRLNSSHRGSSHDRARLKRKNDRLANEVRQHPRDLR